MKKIMPTPFLRILVTTALCLAVGAGLSSCVSRLHRVAYEFPRSYEGAWLQGNSEAINGNAANMRLTKRLYVYECNGQWYLPVSRMQYRKSVIQGARQKAYEISDISHADKRQYYLPISAELAKELCTSRRHGLASHELAPRIQATELLSSLPPQARPHPILCPVYGMDEAEFCLAQTESHVGSSAVWAYPASALLFVVDVPLTVVSTTVGYTVVGIYALLYPSQVFR